MASDSPDGYSKSSIHSDETRTHTHTHIAMSGSDWTAAWPAPGEHRLKVEMLRLSAHLWRPACCGQTEASWRRHSIPLTGIMIDILSPGGELRKSRRAFTAYWLMHSQIKSPHCGCQSRTVSDVPCASLARRGAGSGPFDNRERRNSTLLSSTA